MKNSTKIRAGVKFLSPFIEECVMRNCKNSGINTDLLRIIMRIAGHNEIEFKEYHSYDSLMNTTQGLIRSGIAGGLMNNEIDVSGALLYLDSPEKVHDIEYTYPVTRGTQGFVVRKRAPTSTNLSLDWLMSPFSPYSDSVWLLIFVLGCLFFLIRIISHISSLSSTSKMNLHLNLFKAISVFFLYRAFKSEFLASTVYEDPSQPPFKNLKEFIPLLDEGYFQLYQVIPEMAPDLFSFDLSSKESSEYVRIRKILKRRDKDLKFQPTPKQTYEGIMDDLMEYPYLALITSYAKFLHVARDRCELAFVEIVSERTQIAFGFAKGSPYFEAFNSALYQVQYSAADFYDIIRSHYMDRKRRCEFDTIADHKAVTFYEFAPALTVYICLTLSIILYFILIEFRCIGALINCNVK